jgi:prepilin-type N-terminal cleavage/methylation domain-containing protein
MKRHTSKTKNQKGFTILELMVATTVLSVILLIVTSVMINIGNLYSKGINQARIQDDVRNITDDVSQQLQLSATSEQSGVDTSYGPTINVYCIGNTRYSYVLNTQVNGHLDGLAASPIFTDVLWRDNPPNCQSTHAADLLNPPTDSGTELLAPNSELTAFNITGTSPYTIAVGAAYGSPSLLVNPFAINAACQTTAGDQFCATASLTTTVANRL